ncbi:MAG: 50S ribosome-binding GTPase, partial [Deltaproteobacteria bacterium]|nr:50S ribosome-binding GTPase [Deltaproteobacteria bacterium]
MRPGCEDRAGRQCHKNRHRKRQRGSQRRMQHYNKLESNFGPSSILLVGNLKVGKSTIFSSYVGRRRRVFVYPGTAVELAIGATGTEPFSKIIDTPGFYSLQERSEDALVVRDLLSRKLVGGVLLVLDAKNLRRGLSLAFELAEFQVPLIIALNMHDEARQRGVEINIKRLSELLGVPIIPTVATEGRGLNQLKKALRDARAPKIRLEYPDVLRHLVEEIEVLLAGRNMPIGGIAYLLSMDLTSIN